MGRHPAAGVPATALETSARKVCVHKSCALHAGACADAQNAHTLMMRPPHRVGDKFFWWMTRM